MGWRELLGKKDTTTSASVHQYILWKGQGSFGDKGSVISGQLATKGNEKKKGGGESSARK